MNEEEFNLSEKIVYDIYMNEETGYRKITKAFIKIEDVKEFIKRETWIIDEFIRGKINETEMWIKRQKLAGDKLK